MKDVPDTRADSSPWTVLGAVLTLVTLVVAQSVYEVLANNPEFLAVRLVRARQVLQIVLVFNFLPGLALFLLWGLCLRLHRGLGRAALAGVFFLLFLAFFWQIHNGYLDHWQPFRHAYALWSLPAALLVWASVRWEKAFLSSLATLSPVALVLPGLFLNQTWPSAPERPPTEGADAAVISSPAGAKKLPPIFLLVFDELTVHALLDDSGQIDARRFPHFQQLAADSYWFRNATANASYTRLALPALVSGNPIKAANVSAEEHSTTLFTLLQPYYEITIYEEQTHFCSPRLFHCPEMERTVSARQLLRDVSLLYATRVVPQGLDLGLPDVRRTWGPFRHLRDVIGVQLQRFQQFLDSLGSAPRENTFFFFHHLLPHSPYVLTPEGQLDDARIAYLAFQESMVENRLVLRDLRDRYLLQVGHVDKELGRFLARLKELGLYDKSLLIVTADHGVSWKPEAPGRWLTQSNAEMILSVPFFLKLPFQTRGGQSDQDVQHIDVLPTVADVLKLKLPGKRAGRSVFAPHPEPRKKIAYDPQNGLFEFPDTLGLTRLAVSLEAPLHAPTSPLIGQQVAGFDVVPFQGKAHVYPVVVLPIASGEAGSLVFVSGRLDPSHLPAQMAIAVNGEIVAVTSDFREVLHGKPLVWNASFSPRKLREETNVVSVYVVLDAGNKKLAALPPPRHSTLLKNGLPAA